MKDWNRLFSKTKKSGLHRAGKSASIPGIRKAAEERGLAFFHLDLAGVTGKQDFLNAVAEALGFPDYFGGNWDAFEDCLTDFAWCDAKGYVLLIENSEDLADNAPEEMATALGIFKDAAGFWKGQDTPFFVIIPAELEDSIPKIR